MISVNAKAARPKAVSTDTTGLDESPTQKGGAASQRDTLRLKRAQSLDRDTLGGIYDEFHPLLYSYIYRRVGDVELARDLTADVFRRFLQATAKGNGPNDQLRAWLYRVAHNIVVDHYRGRKNQRIQPLEESLVSDHAPLDSVAEHRLQCDAVRLALGQLTAEQQEIIALKFLEGLTNDEVAHITQRSVGAVKALQHRALAALRRKLILPEEEGLT